MKDHFKYLLFSVSVFCLTCVENHSELTYIRIAHIGASDRIIHSLVLSPDSIINDTDLWVFNIILPDSVLNKIKTVASSIKLHPKRDRLDSIGMDPYEAYNVSLCYKNQSKCENRPIKLSDAKSLFEKIIITFEENKIDSISIDKVKYLKDGIVGYFN